MNLSFHAHALPESYMILDLRRGRIRLRIIPGGVFIGHAVHFQVVILGLALPRALARMRARLQILFFDRLQRKILIAFHHLRVLALCHYFSAPHCFCHLDPASPRLPPAYFSVNPAPLLQSTATHRKESSWLNKVSPITPDFFLLFTSS